MTERDERVRALVRSQVALTIATLALVVGALALLHLHAVGGGTHYVQVMHGGEWRVRVVHDKPGSFIVPLAVAQLVLCGALVVVAIAHAARVIAFVFPREAH